MKRNSKARPNTKPSTAAMRQNAKDYLRRFPPQSTAGTLSNIGMVLIGNALVFWLLWTGELRAAHLIALVMLETALLIVISWLLQRAIPRKDWLEQPKPWRERLPIIIFVMVWLGGAYSITLAMINGYPDFIALLKSPQAWIETRLYIPLLYTLGLALVHAVADLRHYRRRGGPFVSEVGHDAMARYLTLVLGGIPFAMPFFAAAIGGFKGVEYVAGKARVDPTRSTLAGAAMLFVFSASFWLIEGLMDSGVHGWAIGFVFAKLIAEVLIVCMPLIMVRIVREEAPKPAAAGAS